MSPKISVITATFNSAKTIHSTLLSLRCQEYSNFEHVVVDGLSTDSTLGIIRESGVDGAVIDSRSDKGIYDALNRGIELATGDVIGFLHSDDFFPDSDVLAKIAGVFEDPSIEICFGDLAYVSQDDSARVVRRWTSGEYGPLRIKFGWMPPHPTFYVRRELLKRYPFNLDYQISGDYDAMLRLLTREAAKVVYIPCELVHMRVGGASNKSLANILKKTKEDWRVIRSNGVGGVLTLVAKNVRKLPQFFV
jgi:glycosyltransferase